MFESLNPKEKSIISLDLGTPPTLPAPTKPTVAPAQKPEAKPAAVQMCVGQMQTLESAFLHFNGARRRFDDMVRTGLKPEVIFYVVFPQQGLSHSLTTADGLKTIVLTFTSKFMADAYIAAKKMGAVAAACRIENLPQQAEKWMSSGINCYALNACCKCAALSFFPISELTSENLFLTTWRLDLANRRQFAESYGRNSAAVFGTNPKQARAWLEGIRDHIDPANPYLHWTIAILAGVAGDMEVNADSIRRLDGFGPPFAGKLQGTSFDPTVPGSQMSTMAEAAVGLGISLGYLDPSKMTQKPPQPKE